MRLRPQAELDAAIREHVESNHYFDEETGELYEPQEPPEVAGWGEDGDEADRGPGAPERPGGPQVESPEQGSG